MMNSTNLIGRLTKDIELRYSQNGTAVANFTLAVQRRFNKDEADFIRCVAFKKGAEILSQYVKKGHQIGVEGAIQTGSYDDKEGKRVFTTEVIVNNFTFLESKNDNQNVNNNTGYENKQQQPSQNQSQSNPNQSQGEPIDIHDDDLPF